MKERRVVQVGVTMVLCASAAGLVVGVRGTARDTQSHAAPSGSASGIASARNYDDVRLHRYGANASLYDGVFDKHAFEAPHASVKPFDGLGPVIPHRIGPSEPQDCMACHATGLKVGQLVAPKMRHPSHPTCTNCHAEPKSKS